MIPLTQLGRRVGKLVTDNSPAIMTAAGVAGVVTTAVLAGKGTVKADYILTEEQALHHNWYQEKAAQPFGKLRMTWKCYIPATAAGAATIAFIIGAQSISSKRQAAALSLYTLSETAFKEYKDKVVEQIGINKEQKVRDEIVQDRVNRNPSSEVIIVEDGDVLCMELMSSRYFKSNMEKLRRAQNDLNQMILGGDMYASHNDFLGMIGLESNGYGEQVGWNIDNLIDLQFSAVMSADGKPCIGVGYATFPKESFHKFS